MKPFLLFNVLLNFYFVFCMCECVVCVCAGQRFMLGLIFEIRTLTELKVCKVS